MNIETQLYYYESGCDSFLKLGCTRRVESNVGLEDIDLR